MIAIKGMSEIVDCCHCRFCINKGGHAWCAAQSENTTHWIDDDGRGYWEPGWRETTCPLVEVSPLIKGEWIIHDNGDYECSNCHDVFDTDWASGALEFCPECGAKMRQGD